MKLVFAILALMASGSAFAQKQPIADNMTCQQAQIFGSQHRYIDYIERNWGAPTVRRAYFFPISMCAGSEFMVRLNTLDQRSCAVGCEPNPGTSNN